MKKSSLHIFINLLSNAVKFNKQGGSITITLDFASEAGPQKNSTSTTFAKYLWSSVKDTGVGIPQDQLDKIFEKFYQVDSSSTRVYGGTGLGLSIVKSFVEIHGGNIWVESKPDEGTCFYFTLGLGDEGKEEKLLK